MISYLAWLQNMPWFLIPLSVMLAVGLFLFAINQWKQIGKKKKISKLSDKEIEKMIREWVDIPGYVIERIVPETRVIFNFVIKDRSERNVNIIRNTNIPAIIILAGRLKIPTLNRSLDEAKWRKLAGKISIEMARLGIEYVFDGDPNRYEFISLIDPVFLDDSLTDFFFRQRILFVIRAMILVIEITKQYLGEF